jgi:hypothetical protein
MGAMTKRFEICFFYNLSFKPYFEPRQKDVLFLEKDSNEWNDFYLGIVAKATRFWVKYGKYLRTKQIGV